MIKFCKPTIEFEEEMAVRGVLHSGWLAAWEKTKQFEKEFADYVGVGYAIFTNSGTSALKIAYKYFKEHEYVKRLTYPRNTFCATYSAGIEMGLKMVPTKTDHPMVAVWYGGVKNVSLGIWLEDSAHRIEANDPLVGKIRIYSFYVTKNMTTGTGGMLVTNDKDIYEKCRLYWQDGIDMSTYDRQHGGWNYEVKKMAGGYDGNDIAAAIGLAQLKKLHHFNERRNKIRDSYNEAFNTKWQGNHIYPYFVKEEKEIGELIEFLQKNEIQASCHYPKTGWLGVSLPIYPLLTDEEQTKIINTVLLWQSEKY